MQNRSGDRPSARTAEIVSESFDDALVVYDGRSGTAHSLDRGVSTVWRLCDGERTPGRIASEAGLELGFVQRALAELDACELLDAGSTGPRAAGGAALTNRRRLLTGTAALGGAALISSVVVPGSAFAFGSVRNQTFTITGSAPGALTITPTPGTAAQIPVNNTYYVDENGVVSSTPPAIPNVGVRYQSAGDTYDLLVYNNTNAAITVTETLPFAHTNSFGAGGDTEIPFGSNEPVDVSVS